MNHTTEYAKAVELAVRFHQGQTRRDGVTPYLVHPLRVADAFPIGTINKVVAVLHDLFEDTKASPDDLSEAGISQHAIIAVLLLTKGDMEYEEYLRHVCAHPIARAVKKADILDNLADNPTEKQIEKYARALQVLCEK